jgi:hypothetical protein
MRRLKKNEDDNHKRTKGGFYWEHVGKPNLIAFPNKGSIPGWQEDYNMWPNVMQNNPDASHLRRWGLTACCLVGLVCVNEKRVSKV